MEPYKYTEEFASEIYDYPQYNTIPVKLAKPRKTYCDIILDALDLPKFLIFLYSAFNIVLGVLEIVFVYYNQSANGILCDLFNIWSLLLTLGIIRILYCCVDIYFYTVAYNIIRPVRYDLILYIVWVWTFLAAFSLFRDSSCNSIFSDNYYNLQNLLATECITGIVMYLFWIIIVIYCVFFLRRD